jgi:hypothetical protein
MSFQDQIGILTQVFASEIIEDSLAALIRIEPFDLLSMCKSALQNEETFQLIQEGCYRHPNGFSKIPVPFIPSKTARLRLHVFHEPVEFSDIHNHRWDFVSRVLVGNLVSETYEIDLHGSGQKSLTHEQNSDKHSYSLTNGAEVSSKRTTRAVLSSGTAYFMDRSVFHRVGLAEPGYDCATLVFEGVQSGSESQVISQSRIEQVSARDMRYSQHEALALLDLVLDRM